MTFTKEMKITRGIRQIEYILLNYKYRYLFKDVECFMFSLKIYKPFIDYSVMKKCFCFFRKVEMCQRKRNNYQENVTVYNT